MFAAYRCEHLKVVPTAPVIPVISNRETLSRQKHAPKSEDGNSPLSCGPQQVFEIFSRAHGFGSRVHWETACLQPTDAKNH
ncbi:hypothetical protein ACLOJK_008992, partial [Asimina triloba]